MRVIAILLLSKSRTSHSANPGVFRTKSLPCSFHASNEKPNETTARERAQRWRTAGRYDCLVETDGSGTERIL